MNSRFTEKAQEVLNQAKLCAEGMGHTYIGTEHLLMGIICTDCIGAKILDEKKISYLGIYDYVEKMSGVGEPSSLNAITLTPKCKRVLENALSVAKRFDSRFIGSEHLLYSICDDSECVGAKIIVSLGCATQIIKSEIASFSDSVSNFPEFTKKSVPGAPTISAYGVNLVALAKEHHFNPLVARDAECERLIRVLSRRSKNNPCLIGESGVGKTAIVEGLAQKIFDGDVPSELSKKIIVSLDLCAMIAGTKYRGEFEERMRNVLNEVKANDSIILFIDEIHTIIGAGGAEGAIDASNIIKPSLARGEIQLIGATTTEEYRRYIEKDASLERRFQPILIDEPNEDDAIRILHGISEKYERHHGVKISDGAIKSAVYLSKRYINDRYLPDKAIDVIDEACAEKRLKNCKSSSAYRNIEKRLFSLGEEKELAILDGNFDLASQLREEEMILKLELKKQAKSDAPKMGELTINEDDICKVVSSIAKVPVTRLAKEEREGLKDLETSLLSRVIGQENAISTIASAIKRGRQGLKNPNRPIGSFLFLGPTGVGKTHIAKEIASLVFGSYDNIIRLDMSEYAEKHSISRLIGSPPGYIGYDDGGKLTEAIRKKPYSIVLFDEIEKAHEDLYNILLQILEDGSLCDSRGRRADFKNSIIILTSNVGAKSIIEPKKAGFFDASSFNQYEEMKNGINESLKAEFPPEFLNRLDEIIVFNKLTEDNIRKICALMLDDVKKRIEGVGICVNFDDSAIDFLSKIGYDRVYGARPLRRVIVSHVENLISNKMLDESICRGDTITIYSDGTKILLK